MTDLNVTALPDDEWETCVGAGRMMTETMDAHRFDLGDLALTVQKRYGNDALGQFCTDIGLARVQTLREYRRVAARFPAAIRMEFSGALSWSHYQAAMRAGDDAELWLARAADEGWPVATLHRELAAALGKPLPPVKLIEAEGMLHPHGHGATIYVDQAGVPSGLERQRVRVIVYAAGEEAAS